jgi:nucleoid-associated protein YgaU
MPPQLAQEYPGDEVPGTSSWGTSIAMDLPQDGPLKRPVATHKIIDGDTLANLAERYLGSPEHSLAIYEANRDVLPSPEVLPIGTELKIPPRPSHTEPSSELGRVRPVVPIVPSDQADG